MAPPKITLYVDTVSPFAYIAYYILRHNAAFSKCNITYVPIFLGGLMNLCGNKAPLEIKNKDRWIELERLRWAQTFKVPIHKDRPDGFPPLTLSIMRSLAAIHATDGVADQTRLIAALDALFAAFWQRREPTQKPEVLQRVLASALKGGEEEARQVMEAAGQAEGKAALKKATDEAFASGGFGLPWMVCTDAKGKTEGFWGVDHIGQVIDFLGLERPAVGGWRSVL